MGKGKRNQIVEIRKNAKLTFCIRCSKWAPKMDDETGWCSVCACKRDIKFHEWRIFEAEAVLNGDAPKGFDHCASTGAIRKRIEPKPVGTTEKLRCIEEFKLELEEVVRRRDSTQKRAQRKYEKAGITCPRGGNMSFDARFERALKAIAEARVKRGFSGKTAYPVSREDFERW